MHNESVKKTAAIINAVKQYLEYPSGKSSTDSLLKHINLITSDINKALAEWSGVDIYTFFDSVTPSYIRKTLSSNNGISSAAPHKQSAAGYRPTVSIERMTPDEYGNGGSELQIKYFFHDTPYGKVLAASTSKGVCYMAFTDPENNGTDELRAMFPKASLTCSDDPLQRDALTVFDSAHTPAPVKLHISGTDFRFKVWEALLRIPAGTVSTYGDIAGYIGSPLAHRAVGSAVGANPVAYVIPCHRIVLSSGALGNYRWGRALKHAMIGRELSQARKKK